MLVPRSRSKPDDSVPTSSMADIAFLLLIFFLVTTVFPRDQGLAIRLPQADQQLDVSPRNILRFVVLEAGGVELRRGSDERGPSISTDDIPIVWRREIAENPALIAVVQTHPGSAYGAMVTVLDGLKQARAERISLQVLSGGS